VNVHLRINNSTWRFTGKGTYERHDQRGSFLRIDVDDTEAPFTLFIRDQDSAPIEISPDPTGQAHFLLRIS
jgi:hypothetical protein